MRRDAEARNLGRRSEARGYLPDDKPGELSVGRM